MRLKIFSVFDSKADAFLQPFYALTTGIAVRMFEETCSDTEHQFHRHAADFTLMELGTFDQQKGTFEIQKVQLNLGNALTFIQMSNALPPIEGEGEPS